MLKVPKGLMAKTRERLVEEPALALAMAVAHLPECALSGNLHQKVLVRLSLPFPGQLRYNTLKSWATSASDWPIGAGETSHYGGHTGPVYPRGLFCLARLEGSHPGTDPGPR